MFVRKTYSCSLEVKSVFVTGSNLKSMTAAFEYIRHAILRISNFQLCLQYLTGHWYGYTLYHFYYGHSLDIQCNSTPGSDIILIPDDFNLDQKLQQPCDDDPIVYESALHGIVDTKCDNTNDLTYVPAEPST